MAGHIAGEDIKEKDMDIAAAQQNTIEASDLHALIESGDTAELMTAIKAKATLVNEVAEEGLSVFESLLNAGYTNVASEIIKMEGFDVNHAGHNPLRIAVATGNIDIAQSLLTLGASPNYRSDGMSSALLLCLENEYFKLAELMVEHGAEVDIRNAKGWTPLIWAAMKGRQKAVEFLLARGANIHACTNDGWNAVTGAYFKKRTSIVDLLLSKGAVFGAKYAEAALLSAYHNGYGDVVLHLLNEMSTSPNVSDEKDVSLLAKAVEKADWPLVKVLLAKGADVNVMTSKGSPLIAHLAKNGEDEMIAFFLGHGADVNLASSTGKTAFYIAAAFNQIESIKLLASNGASINYQTETGWTALMIAARDGYLAATEALLELDVNIELTTVKGSTAKAIALSNAPRTRSRLDDSAFKDIAEKLTLPRHFIDG